MGNKAVQGEVVPKHAGGRPPKLTKLQRQEVYNAFKSYLERTPDATIVGFCAFDPVGFKYFITKDDIYNWEEFSELRKIAIQKQEAYLLMGATTGKLNATMAIFRLKQPQHGYTDKHEVDNKIEMVQPIVGGLAKKQIESGDDADDYAEVKLIDIRP